MIEPDPGDRRPRRGADGPRRGLSLVGVARGHDEIKPFRPGEMMCEPTAENAGPTDQEHAPPAHHVSGRVNRWRWAGSGISQAVFCPKRR